MKPAIKIQSLSKLYRLGQLGTGSLSHDLKRWYYRMRGKEDPYLKIGEENKQSIKSESEYIWAIKDINLEIMPGDIVGIIGKNGAGKSTLLKILSKVTGPTTGRIDYDGRIGALLEVGTGFHHELTGRENIFLNGAILGMTKAEIKSKLEEIIDFSGIERYIDTPVKRYSSGMKVRLGFAVAAHLEPEILVVDEVLAVGDAEFQKKAIGKMQDVSRMDGRTVLFVSHNMGAVKNLCKTGVLLESGQLKMNDEIEKVVNSYLFNHSSNNEQTYYPSENIVKSITAKQQLGKIELTLKYKSDKFLKQPLFGFRVLDKYEYPLFGTNPLQNGILDYGNPKKEGEVRVVISSPYLMDGTYPVTVWFNDGKTRGEPIFFKENCLSLHVSNMNNSFIDKNPNQGLIIPECKWYFE